MGRLRGADAPSNRVGGRALRLSRVHGSEDALADLPLARLVGRRAMRMVIGGLGAGFTGAAALRRLGDDSAAVVAELGAEVVACNRGPLSAGAGPGSSASSCPPPVFAPKERQ